MGASGQEEGHTREPLRIAHVTNEPFGLESPNGVQQVVYCLARAQADLGESVAVFSREDRKAHVLRDAPAQRERMAMVTRSELPQGMRGRLLSPYFEKALGAQVLAWQPDVVHFHSIHVLRNVALGQWLHRAGIQYCVTPHGGLFPVALRRGRSRKLAMRLLFERVYLNDALFVHAVSPHEIDALRRYGVSSRVVVAPNGLPPDVTPEPLRLADPSKAGSPARRTFTFIGRLDPWQKGLDLLVEAFAEAGLGEAELVLVGPDWRGSRRSLARLAERRGVSGHVVFTGPAFGHERARLLAAADVFVHPSRWEGLSLSVLIAAAAGKPCLITREADPLGELERARGAEIVEAGVASIAAGLKRLSSLDRFDLERMGTRARRAVEAHFTWPSAAARIGEAYRAGQHDGPAARPLETS